MANRHTLLMHIKGVEVKLHAFLNFEVNVSVEFEAEDVPFVVLFRNFCLYISPDILMKPTRLVV